ncbi:MAG: hypothetical protein KGH65_05215 [Candidatus Micrarchaeota archaeon]|nr:hypothetical protein [Candidatus Micrarchaeota archaeon]
MKANLTGGNLPLSLLPFAAEIERLKEINSELLTAALFVVQNLPATLSNSLGRTSYEQGCRAAEIAERELVNLRAAIVKANHA